MKNRKASFALESLGCAKNQVDSEIMIAALSRMGVEHTTDADKADLLIVNTCGFIESAKQESLDACLALRIRYPAKKIILAGCLAQRYGEALARELPEIDGCFAGRDPWEIREMAASLLNRGVPESVSEIGDEAGRTKLLSFPGSAYVKIADGCDNRCAYCAIPLIKGGLKSRSRRDIREEILRLLDRGIWEINLIAQDLASYGRDREAEAAAYAGAGETSAGELLELLQDIASIEQDFWIRLLYIHPDHFPLEVLDLVRADRRFLPYFDVPFQHADQDILRAMGRRGNASLHLELIETIRGRIPEAVIRSTFLVGFPGETDASFEALLSFQDHAQLDWVGTFAYSREEGTPAYSMRDQVKKSVAARRKAELERRQVEISERRLNRFVGRDYPLLIEEAVMGEELFLARGYMHAPEVDGLAVLKGKGFPPGTVVSARIEKRNGFDLLASPLGEGGQPR